MTGVRLGLRLAVIFSIFLLASAAWVVLGTSMLFRSEQSSHELEGEVADLWGAPQEQQAPQAFYLVPTKVTKIVESPAMATAAEGPVAAAQATAKKITVTKDEERLLQPQRSDISVKLETDYRQKGLLWYSTYRIKFHGDYTFRNETDAARTVFVRFLFPAQDAVFDDFEFTVNGVPVPTGAELQNGVTGSVRLDPGAEAKVTLGYRSRGLDDWTYMAGEGMTSVRDFKLVATTDFKNPDFVKGTISPTHKELTPDGWKLSWSFKHLLSAFRIGIEIPKRLNPGPLASRMSFFAPLPLLFFLVVLVVLGLVKGRNLHPMHYAFISAAFFSYHLLFSYLADQVSAHTAVLTSSIVSLVLVVNYVRMFAGWGFALRYAGLSQFVFLILFSYAFFFPGYTGLTVTIGSILTLAMLMQITGRVDWEHKLGGGQAGPQPPAPAAPS